MKAFPLSRRHVMFAGAASLLGAPAFAQSDRTIRFILPVASGSGVSSGGNVSSGPGVTKPVPGGVGVGAATLTPMQLARKTAADAMSSATVGDTAGGVRYSSFASSTRVAATLWPRDVRA